MSNTLQDFFVVATQKAANSLAAALLRLPEDRRGWSPESTARTALDQVAECAILNGYTADLIRTGQWAASAFDTFPGEKSAAVALGADRLNALLQENTQKAIDALRAVPDDALNRDVAMPWGSQTLAEIIAYPYWNMTYHEGQINYLASMLGCLDG